MSCCLFLTPFCFQLIYPKEGKQALQVNLSLSLTPTITVKLFYLLPLQSLNPFLSFLSLWSLKQAKNNVTLLASWSLQIFIHQRSDVGLSTSWNPNPCSHTSTYQIHRNLHLCLQNMEIPYPKPYLHFHASPQSSNNNNHPLLLFRQATDQHEKEHYALHWDDNENFYEHTRFGFPFHDRSLCEI